MTCEDCVHNGVCSGFIPTDLDRDVFDYCREGRTDEIPDIEERCFDFKPKSRYIELPCAVGDTVYWVTRSCDENGREESVIHEGNIISFSLQNDGLRFYCRYKHGLTFWLKIEYFGKIVFLTREEAEKALENKQ